MAGTAFVYDYFMKDHLGNTRMVLTEEGQTDAYPDASLEASRRAQESLYYNIPNGTQVYRLNVPGYPNDGYTNPNDSIQMLSDSSTAIKVGSSIVIKVMAGDTVNIRATSWYRKNGAAPGGTDPAHFSTPLLQQTGVLDPGITTFLNNVTSNYSTDTTKPKAYLNWISPDEQFRPVIADGKNSGFDRVGNDTILKTHLISGQVLTKGGYLFVYVSNESPNINVYFDNLQLIHIRGRIMEETHYYPFGLTMFGLSSQEIGKPENKNKFNKGSELQNKEFSDGSGLELYATQFRMYDPQLGRWHTLDPKPNYSHNLFSAMNNNPILYNDPPGDTVWIRYDNVEYRDGSEFTGKKKGFLKETFNALNEGAKGSKRANTILNELEGSKNKFTIVSGEKNNFVPSDPNKAYANQLKTDPDAAVQYDAIKKSGKDISGGSGGTVTWNSSTGYVSVVGGDVDNNTTTNLFHELSHVADANEGLTDSREVNGLERSEWQASFNENIIRSEMNAPTRESYNRRDGTSVRLLDDNNEPLIPLWYLPILPINW